MATQVVIVGECMLELSRPGASAGLGTGWQLGFGGDTFNTALYLRRLGVDVAYLTALGTDCFSAELRQAWAAEEIDLSLVLCAPDRIPGLYAIRTDPAGERTFSYWRTQSAARQLFRSPGIEESLQVARAAKLLYLSGITLSIFEPDDRQRLLELARDVRTAGGIVAFDPNYRPACWESVAAARSTMASFAACASIALPTFDDEQRLWGDDTPWQTTKRWQDLGAAEVVVKQGATGCLISLAGMCEEVPAVPVSQVVDTTGAGDAFNAAYLAARLRADQPTAAARAGHALAARVIQHPGAIMPSALM